MTDWDDIETVTEVAKVDTLRTAERELQESAARMYRALAQIADGVAAGTEAQLIKAYSKAISIARKAIGEEDTGIMEVK